MSLPDEKTISSQWVPKLTVSKSDSLVAWPDSGLPSNRFHPFQLGKTCALMNRLLKNHEKP